MGVCRVVPQRLRVVLPILTALNAGLLVTAHLCKGASTQVDGHAPLGTLTPHAASDDNLISAVRRLADAHAWLMVIVVAVMSGLWPYVKLLGTMGVVASADMGRLSKEGSYQLLCILEVLGKYSFADVVLVCFNAVIFDISTGGEYTIVIVGSLQLDMYMHLKFGSIALIVAVTFSTLLTHWASYELGPGSPGQKARELAARRAEEEEDEEEQPLLEEEGGSGSGGQAAAPVLGLATALAALTGLALLVVGSVTVAVEVKRGGFLGKLIRPDSEQDLKMSVFSMAHSMMESARSRSEGGTTFFAVAFVLLTYVAPLLELTSLVACGLVVALGAPKPWLPRLEQLASWLGSFGVVDVFLLVCLAVLAEIKTVVDFNIGDECRPFETIMNNRALLTVAGLGFAASDSCFSPHASLHSGWWILLVSVLFRTAAWRGVVAAMRPREAAALHEA